MRYDILPDSIEMDVGRGIVIVEKVWLLLGGEFDCSAVLVTDDVEIFVEVVLIMDVKVGDNSEAISNSELVTDKLVA